METELVTWKGIVAVCYLGSGLCLVILLTLIEWIYDIWRGGEQYGSLFGEDYWMLVLLPFVLPLLLLDFSLRALVKKFRSFI